MSSIAKYDNVSTRAGFNSVVRHVKSTVSFVESVSSGINLAESFAGEAGGSLDSEQKAAILRMTLVDKFGYRTCSRNLRSISDRFEDVAGEIAKWNSVDVVIAYHHPDLGLLTANPKDPDQLNAFGSLRKRELAVAYVGRFGEPSDELCATAAELALTLLEGGKADIPAALYKGSFAYRKAQKKAAPAAPRKTKAKAAPAPKKEKAKAAPVPVVVEAKPAAAPVVAVPGAAKRMTPMYSVVVQNELFHNGNVEAWKRIIDSYKTKHPTLEVYIYYDGERILNLNSLFKWGKVKHGSSIQFAVAGDDIKDVAKLQRYLIQGASHQFEAFLHGPVSTALKLF
jgi:hypothetical protein